jgi:hypothetical protein
MHLEWLKRVPQGQVMLSILHLVLGQTVVAIKVSTIHARMASPERLLIPILVLVKHAIQKIGGPNSLMPHVAKHVKQIRKMLFHAVSLEVALIFQENRQKSVVRVPTIIMVFLIPAPMGTKVHSNNLQKKRPTA